MPLATDAIDSELMSPSNDLPPLRCVSSSMELDGYGISSVSQLALPDVPLQGGVGGGGRASDIGLLGGRGCGWRSGFGDWIGSATRSRKRGQSAGSAPFAALDRPFALRPLLQASRSGFLVRQKSLSEQKTRNEFVDGRALRTTWRTQRTQRARMVERSQRQRQR
jgi:hypothetical protein